MESVLVVGRIKASRRRRVEGLLRAGPLRRLPGRLTRHSVYRQGDTLVLLFEGPAATQDFVELLEAGGRLEELVDSLESVPLLPRELVRLDRPSARRATG